MGPKSASCKLNQSNVAVEKESLLDQLSVKDVSFGVSSTAMPRTLVTATNVVKSKLLSIQVMLRGAKVIFGVSLGLLIAFGTSPNQMSFDTVKQYRAIMKLLDHLCRGDF
jgi:hypothetical protein